MTASDYAFIVAFLKLRSGLSLGPEKHYLVQSRLTPLCRAAGLDGLGGLVLALRHSRRDDPLASMVVDAMATHETLFFRDGTPFEALRKTIMPKLAACSRAGAPVRIWSAAASTGQEAYSIAMLLTEFGEGPGRRSVEILATDMVASAVARGRAGVYSQFEVQRGLPIRSLLRHFRQTEAGWEILPRLRAMVEFRVFNLLEDCRPLGHFDVVFCRNILIYLDNEMKRSLLARLAGALAPGGVLCLGSAETTVGLSTALIPHDGARGYFVAAPQAAAPASVQPLRAALA